MFFASFGVDDSVITLNIRESKVESLANSLFNVQIESGRHVRSLVFPGGARALPSPEIILKGVAIDVIRRFFGLEIYTSVMASHMRAEGVSMTLPVNSSSVATVKLTLEAFSAIRIAQKIFPP